MCRSTGELAASTCAKRIKSRGEAGLLRMARAIRGMPGSEFEPRRPLQKEYPIRQDGVFFLECAAAPKNSLPRPARSASNQEVRQGSCEWRQPFVGCREASSSLVARSKTPPDRVVFFRVRLSAHRRVSQLPAATFFSLLRHISRSHDKEMGETDEI